MYQMNPVIRLKRLKADHASMIELSRASRRITYVSRGSPPEQYLITYHCKGTVVVDGKVTIGTQHSVEIFLHADYPATSPRFKLRTPLFHPNFKYGDPNLQVCIEAKNWTPREPLDELVLRIGNMIIYRNYNPSNPLDAVAARWAVNNAHLFPLEEAPWLTPAGELIEILETGVAAEEDDAGSATPIAELDDPNKGPTSRGEGSIS
jgi:ubiquitin-protein ligase